MKIALGTDHAGYKYKEAVREYLLANGHEVEDFGCFNDESCDYPDFVKPAARSVVEGKNERAIVFGGSGNGEAIAANKVKGVRAALCWNEQTAEWSRSHNDSNVLSIGERTIPVEMALKIVQIWLDTPFEGGRHERRIEKIETA